MSDYTIKCTLLYHLEKRRSVQIAAINKIPILQELRDLIGEYLFDYCIDVYDTIINRSFLSQNRPWLDNSNLSRWSTISVSCKNIISFREVIISHSHHQMTTTALEISSIMIPFEMICNAIQSGDTTSIEKLLIIPDNQRLGCKLPMDWVERATINGVKSLLGIGLH